MNNVVHNIDQCEFSDYYTTAYINEVTLQNSQPETVVRSYLLQTPTREAALCSGGVVEPQVVYLPEHHIYIDLLAVVLQLTILAILLIGLPALFTRKFLQLKLAITSTILGLLYGSILIFLAGDSKIEGLVITGTTIAIVTFSILSILIYKNHSKK